MKRSQSLAHRWLKSSILTETECKSGPLCFASGFVRSRGKCPASHDSAPLYQRVQAFSTATGKMSYVFGGAPHQSDSGGRGGGGGGGGRGGRGSGGWGRGGRDTAFRTESEVHLNENISNNFAQGAASRTQRDLEDFLKGIDRKPYGQYKALLGSYICIHPVEKVKYTLVIDKVQPDPFAPPSSLRIKIQTADARIPKNIYDTRITKIAFCDYVTRQVRHLIKAEGLNIAQSGGGWRSSKGGDLSINSPSQQVIERTSCMIHRAVDDTDTLELRLALNLPAQGRSILGYAAIELLTVKLPALVQKGLLWETSDTESAWAHIRSVQVQEALRSALPDCGLVAFVGNGSMLPRISGASPLPMGKQNAVLFESPEHLKVRIETGVLDREGSKIVVEGMGIPRGVTVITGGGFHGKTTLLEALELGIYNVKPGDGRELVVTDPTAFKIRAEDGRNVVGTDISPFINNLPGPYGLTTGFTSADASGSTSMAANIQEAIEVGATTLLIDEDTSATNFLVRDKRMQVLIRSEPIEPFVSKARSLFHDHGVSTIITIGGCGDYLTIADTVICMEAYQALDITPRAREVVAEYPVSIKQTTTYGTISNRIPVLPDFHSYGKSPRVQGTRVIQLPRAPEGSGDRALVDLASISQLVETGQTNVCAEVLKYISKSKTRYSMAQWATFLKSLVDAEGLDVLRGDKVKVGSLVRPRELEILCAVNRVRGLAVVREEGGGLFESAISDVAVAVGNDDEIMLDEDEGSS